jgi:hypothetical protein
MTQPAAAPTLPWPAMWPATPPTIAPLMHPFAWTALEDARPSRAVQMIRLFMTVFSGIRAGQSQQATVCSQQGLRSRNILFSVKLRSWLGKQEHFCRDEKCIRRVCDGDEDKSHQFADHDFDAKNDPPKRAVFLFNEFGHHITGALCGLPMHRRVCWPGRTFSIPTFARPRFDPAG